MYYLLHELNHAAMTPFRAAADLTKFAWRNPLNPLSQTPLARSVAAAAELFERSTRRYSKPEFGIEHTGIDGVEHAIHERNVWTRPFCSLKRFERVGKDGAVSPGPKLLIVAPLSGHYATLLRGTVEAMLPHADTYITDWTDARMVPLAQGSFDLDDYIDYVIAMLEHLGPDVHVMAVCQPAVPVLAAVSVMEAQSSNVLPATMTLMGGPIDTRINPTAVNALAESKSIDWFERRVIMQVPWPQPGFLRRVYPGFLQLGGFMSMNLDRHVTAHREFFEHLVQKDGDSAEKHREFYDEYLAVMDLTAEFYLQTVETVFIEHALPKGEMMHRDVRVDPSLIRHTALLTIEGENDDISGVGQTEAAHRLCSNLPDEKREHYVQPDVGHYGIFNGSRFRKHIVPRVVAFMERGAPALEAVDTGEGTAVGTEAPAAKRRRAAAPDPGPEPAPILKADTAELNGSKLNGSKSLAAESAAVEANEPPKAAPTKPVRRKATKATMTKSEAKTRATARKRPAPVSAASATAKPATAERDASSAPSAVAKPKGDSNPSTATSKDAPQNGASRPESRNRVAETIATETRADAPSAKPAEAAIPKAVQEAVAPNGADQAKDASNTETVSSSDKTVSAPFVLADPTKATAGAAASSAPPSAPSSLERTEAKRTSSDRPRTPTNKPSGDKPSGSKPSGDKRSRGARPAASQGRRT